VGARGGGSAEGGLANTQPAVGCKRELGAPLHSTSHGEDMVAYVVAFHESLRSVEG